MRDASCEIARSGPAGEYAAELLGSLGFGVARRAAAPEPHAALTWARCGGMALSGFADGPPRSEAAGVALVAEGAAQALRAVAARRGVDLALDGPALLGERAALLGLARRGRESAGGACRLLRAADGWIAASLARPDDLASLPAWLGEGAIDEPWYFVAERVRARPLAATVERARLLGLPVAGLAQPARRAPRWMRVAARGAERAARTRPLVVDLSSLWAGPLCAQLLRISGAHVVKVESAARPDGARAQPAFFALLNQGKESVVLDFTCAQGRAALERLVAEADVVVESARPRALAQLGVDAEALVAARPGLVWVAISGYGRREPGASWVAFGDDAAAAAGLPALAGADAPVFCADAVADPLTGLHAALAALASLERGGGVLLDLALRDVAAQAARFAGAGAGARVVAAAVGFEVEVGGVRQPVLAPRSRAGARS